MVNAYRCDALQTHSGADLLHGERNIGSPADLSLHRGAWLFISNLSDRHCKVLRV